MSFSPFKSSLSIGGKLVQIEAGGLARQADGSVLISCGDDQILVTVVSEREESVLDFFPLTVEYQEKFYSTGRIPGSFFRREGRPSHGAIITGRLIDRPIRPCFPENCYYDTQIVVSALSYSGQCSFNALAGLGASAALHISDIPFNGPVAFVQVVKVGEQFIANPSITEREKASLDILVAGSQKGLLMVEGEAKFVTEAEALAILKFASEQIQPLLDVQNDLRKKTGMKAKRKWIPFELNPDWQKTLKQLLTDPIKSALNLPKKVDRYQAFRELKKSTQQQFIQKDDDAETQILKKKNLNVAFDTIKYKQARSNILQSNQRIDGRSFEDVRPISSQNSLLKRTHGSALFTRGETQVLGSVTLGTGEDEQTVDTLEGYSKKRFFLHYNFPPSCVGETGRLGGQSRREVGHGFLAEKALKAVLPKHDNFPYTIRLVGEVLESNGSSSMGTVCAGSMALMDAGVPVKEPVAGIAMGLIKEGDKVVILSDILGDEDHLGDMDLKVAGGKDGITALQMDIKTEGLSFAVLEKALLQAKNGRLYILDKMSQTIDVPKKKLSPYAPRIQILYIQPEKIRDVIGTGGKVINKIIEETGVKIDIEDSGKTCIFSTDEELLAKAKYMIEGICEGVKPGNVYDGKVDKTVTFGAFVEILPSIKGLVHISEIGHKRIQEVTDVLKKGDSVKVKVLDVDANGRIRLSRKAILPSSNTKTSTKKYGTQPRTQSGTTKRYHTKKQ